MWRGEVRRGRPGQDFDFGEPGVLDGATTKSLAAGRHGPRQLGQIVKTKQRSVPHRAVANGSAGIARSIMSSLKSSRSRSGPSAGS